ncbi:MAG: ECF-type sigma factor, partial [Planctomycetota bacterium]
HGLDEVVIALERSVGGLLDLNEALDELAAQDEELARVVEQHFFGGLAYAEIAALLGVTTRTIERRMATARGWLHMRLKDKRA